MGKKTSGRNFRRKDSTERENLHFEKIALIRGVQGGNGKNLSAFPSFFFCVPKRRNKKKAPQPVPALRASLTSRRGRQDKWGKERKIPLARRRAPERLPKKGFALFERSEFAKPRQHRGAQGLPPSAGQVPGCPFFGSFLWASKEMNILIRPCNFIQKETKEKGNYKNPTAYPISPG
jgi:hypothetical protein